MTKLIVKGYHMNNYPSKILKMVKVNTSKVAENNSRKFSAIMFS